MCERLGVVIAGPNGHRDTIKPAIVRAAPIGEILVHLEVIQRDHRRR
jgi:hypothetical protein